MTFSVIGTGNIAWFFSKRIAAAGHKCNMVYGRNAEEVKKLSEALLSRGVGNLESISGDTADVCFLAVSDNAIADVAQKIKFDTTVLVHMAGSQELDIIKGAAKERAILWPIYSILKANPPGHRNIPIAWEASSDRAKRFVLEMAHAVTDNLFEAKWEQRKWLHVSAVMTNNFINHLLAISEKICSENNLPASTLQPLITQTFDRAINSSPFNTQTGPAVRKDTNTIEQHLSLLTAHKEWKKIYEAMTKSIGKMYEVKV